jgi:hypothetical protein
MINCDCCHHRLASPWYTGTEQRLVGSLQPSLKLRRVKKPLPRAFLSLTDDIVLLGWEVCRRQPMHYRIALLELLSVQFQILHASDRNDVCLDGWYGVSHE